MYHNRRPHYGNNNNYRGGGRNFNNNNNLGKQVYDLTNIVHDLVSRFDTMNSSRSNNRHAQQGPGKASRGNGKNKKGNRGNNNQQTPPKPWFDQVVANLSSSCSKVVDGTGMTVKQILTEICKVPTTRFTVVPGSKKNGHKIFMFGKKLAEPALVPQCGLQKIKALFQKQHDVKKEAIAGEIPIKCGKKYFRFDGGTRSFKECDPPGKAGPLTKKQQKQQHQQVIAAADSQENARAKKQQPQQQNVDAAVPTAATTTSSEK